MRLFCLIFQHCDAWLRGIFRYFCPKGKSFEGLRWKCILDFGTANSSKKALFPKGICQALGNLLYEWREPKIDQKSTTSKVLQKGSALKMQWKGFHIVVKWLKINTFTTTFYFIEVLVYILQNLVFSRFFQPCNFRNYFWEIKVGTKMQFQCVFTNFWSIFFFNFEHCEYVLRLLIKYMSKIRTEN